MLNNGHNSLVILPLLELQSAAYVISQAIKIILHKRFTIVITAKTVTVKTVIAIFSDDFIINFLYSFYFQAMCTMSTINRY